MAVIANRIFVNNVPQSAHREDLIAHFSQFGNTLDVFLPASFSSPGMHKGIGFVTFAAPDSVEMAMQFPAHTIHGQPVSVEMCLAKKGEGKGQGLPGCANTGERVFVTNIGQEVTQEEVQAYFAQWGDWTDLYMPRGSYTAGHKGICFISYKDPSAVTQVLQHGAHQLRGQPIVVDVAVPRGDQKGAGKGHSAAHSPGPAPAAYPSHGKPAWKDPSWTGSSWTPPPATRYLPPAWPPSYQPRSTAWTPAPSPPTGGGGTPAPGRLFITKMDRTLTKEDLTAYFQRFGDLNDVYIPPGGKLIAFVGYCDPAATQAILQHKTHEVKPGCTVDVDAAIERPPLGGKGQGKRWQPY
mmetsp:Transcript_30900/g.91839  ORF Transcript_30900/g.91839 Transcript_30900/m.91839 type:complete len:352 (-) Transcript_30900:16-1071(-)